MSKKNISKSEGERHWVNSLVENIQRRLNRAWTLPSTLVVKNEDPLTYAFEIAAYAEDDASPPARRKQYKTDLIIKEYVEAESGR